MRKLFTLLLAVAASMGTMFAWDYKRVQIGDLYYNFDATNQTAEVTYSYNNYYNDDRTITRANIPASVTYNEVEYSVTSIGDLAFYKCSGLTSVTIPNSVTSIGNNAFGDCSGLTSIEIPNSVTSIGYSAFSDCDVLTSVTIPNSVTSIGGWAFQYCDGLISIEIPESVTSIGERAFCGLDNLVSIDVVSNNKNYCSIDGVLFNKEQTELIQYPTGNTRTEYVIPNSVTSIGMSAFAYCSSLTSVTIPHGVTSIGKSAFDGCYNLTSVTIPNSVTCIGDGAFYQCYNLTSINVETSNPNYCSIEGVLFNKEQTELIQYPTGNTHTEYVIPNSVTSIGESAFSNCDNLTSITIPNSVTSIGNYAFSGCSGLPVIDNCRYAGTYLIGVVDNTQSTYKIREGTKWIGSGAFYYCKGLTSIEIPESVTSIGDRAFDECTGLTSVTIPNSVTSIGSGVFAGCSSLPVIDNVRYADTYLVEVVDKTLSNYTFKEGTRFIGTSAFSRCKGLTSIEIPNSVTSIGDHAFSWCSGLTSVTIPNSVISIGKYAFKDCGGLTSVTIPTNVTSIGTEAFSSYYGGLTSVTLNSDSVVSKAYTPEQSFKNIFGSQVKKYIIGEDVTGIGDYAFYDCVDITSVTIPNSVTNIGKYAFAVCCNLASVTIPNTVDNIGEQAFLGVHNIRYEGKATGIPWGALSANSNVLSIPEITSIASALAANETSADYYQFSGVISSIQGVATDYGNATFYISDGTNTFYCYRIYDYYSTNFTDRYSLHVGDSVVISSKVENHYYNSKFTPEAKQGRIVFHSANPLYTNDGVYFYGRRMLNPGELKLYSAYGVDTLNVPEKVSFGGKDYTVTEIAGDALYSRGALKCVKLPKTLQYMSNAFNKCDSIETIYYNAKNLNKPTKHSFADSKLSVKNVYIGEDVEFLPDSVFCNLQAIEKVEWNAINCSGTIPPFYSSRGTITSFNFGEKVSSIPTRLCQEMTGITSVTIPESVQSTGMFPFLGCSGLRSATWNAVNCTTHDDGQYVYPPFQKCENLTNFTIGENVESLPRGLCYAMPISSVVIPNKVKSIGVSAFRECANLKSIEIPNSVTSIGDFAFEFCSSANPLKIGNSVTSIGEQAFAVCSSVTSIEIPRSVTSLGKYAFAECENLDTLYLGENITAYGDSVFAWCTKLSAIYNYREKPAKLGKGAFDGVDYFNCTLYVLAGSVDMYKSTGSDWKDFYFVEPIGANTTSLNANEVTVVPAENTALFTWPVNSNASTYTLQITKDGVVFCTLVFNGNGQLTGIAFAPAKNGSKYNTTEKSENISGLQFTVTGLSAATKYAYNLVTTGSDDSVLASYTGTFGTTGYNEDDSDDNSDEGNGGNSGDSGSGNDSGNGNGDNSGDNSGNQAIDDVQSDDVQCTKVVRNGQVFILRGDKTYTLQGQEVK